MRPERVFLGEIDPVHPALVRTPVSGAELGRSSTVSLSRQSVHFRPARVEGQVDDCRLADAAIWLIVDFSAGPIADRRTSSSNRGFLS
jgi:hypothetical protein